MDKQYIRLKYANQRYRFEITLEQFLNPEMMECWKKGESEYTSFYESVIEYIATYSEFDQDIERLQPYYTGFLYTPDEVQKVREYGEYLWNWAHALHPKAKEHEKKYRNYDYIYLVDASLPEVLEKTKELYDYMKVNDEKYDFARSLDGCLNDDTWFDED